MQTHSFFGRNESHKLQSYGSSTSPCHEVHIIKKNKLNITKRKVKDRSRYGVARAIRTEQFKKTVKRLIHLGKVM